MNEFLQRLKQRKVVQWALAHVAFAFALLQGVHIFAQRFDWPESIERGLLIAVCAASVARRRGCPWSGAKPRPRLAHECVITT
ncbi:MAG: hypothetical protein WB784_11530 [Rhodanobacteraceae bacterium]